MKAVIRLDVPDWQIGQEVSVYFPDTMLKKGKCEAEDDLQITKEQNQRIWDLLCKQEELQDDVRNLTEENEQLMKEHKQLVDKYVPLVMDNPQIVRCRDCKFAFQHWENFYRCDNCRDTEHGHGNHNGNWFCADGERRADDAR